MTTGVCTYHFKFVCSLQGNHWGDNSEHSLLLIAWLVRSVERLPHDLKCSLLVRGTVSVLSGVWITNKFETSFTIYIHEM